MMWYHDLSSVGAPDLQSEVQPSAGTGGSFALFAQLRRQGLLTSHKIEAHSGRPHCSAAARRNNQPPTGEHVVTDGATPPPNVRAVNCSGEQALCMRTL